MTQSMMTSDDARLDEAVAVVGMAGRFPGARTVDQLWRNLLDRVESVRVFTRDELRAAGVAASLIEDPDYVPAKGMLEGIESFDERFFDYSAREAQLMDPQHRLFLECAWHALERAGFDPERHAGAAGVFASAGMSTYLIELASDPGLRERVGLYDLFLHNAPDYLATRVSYKAGLTGPSFTVQTGCSSSLVAVHLACQSLLSGECDLALAGGVTARAPQRRGYLHEAGSALSSDGHCRPFDARADGTVPGEAVAVVALKRVADAIRDGNHIHAVVAGSAINNDGHRKVGYTAPSVEGQCNAISEALEVAGVSPRDVGYVEAHGTATRIGDPLEVAALSKAFRARTSDRQYCALGAIKSNIGHVDAAAGIAGFVKAVLAVEHGVIPATLHYETPNPEIDFPRSPFFVNRDTLPWNNAGQLRCAGVSAFGVGGTNAHAVVAQAPARARSARVQVPGGPQLIVLSARSAAALDRVTEDLRGQLAAEPSPSSAERLADLAFTSRTARRAFEHRRAIVASDAGEVVAAIQSHNPVAMRTGKKRPRSIAFLFPGGGTQYANMGRGLYDAEPVFRSTIDRCCEVARDQIGVDLRALLYPDAISVPEADLRLRRATYSVPAIWMTGYALARLLMSWGVTPQVMIGHSLGEYVAACVSGVLSMPDALTLATFRALVLERLGRGARGASLSVNLGEHELRPLLPARVDIGVVNTPASCVASGPEGAIAELEQVLVAREVSFRRLKIEAAVHSSLMDPVLDEVRQFASRLSPGRPSIPYYSNLKGRLIAPDDLTPDYWAQHLRQTARVSDNIAGMLQQQRGLVAFEVGPGTSLASAVAAQIMPDRPDRPDLDVVMLSAMRQARDPRGDRDVLVQCIGGAWSHGVDIDWRAFQGGDASDERRLAMFPVYSFERTRHWIEPARPAAPDAPGVPGVGPEAGPGAEPEAGPGTGPEAARNGTQRTRDVLAEAAPAPAVSLGLGQAVQLPPVYHGDALAHAVADSWGDQLGVTELEAESNFFALGGTSLVAVRLISHLQRQLQPGRRLLPEELLRTPSFGPFVEQLRPAYPGSSASPADPANPANPAHPANSANPANPANPANSANSANSANPAHPAHRASSANNEVLAPGPDAGRSDGEPRTRGVTGGDPGSSLVLLRAGRAAEHRSPGSPGSPQPLQPLFIVHPAGGHVFHYRLLAEALAPQITIYGLKAPGLDDDRAPLSTIEALAEHHLRSLGAAGHTAGPYYLAGSSFGGCVAYEMAQQLRASGEQVAMLAMLDTPAPDDLPRFADHVEYVEYLFGDMWGVTLSRDELGALPEPDRIPHAIRRLAGAGVELGLDGAAAENILALFVASERAMRAYRPRPYPGPVVYFRARERRSRDPDQPERGWRRYTGDGLALEIVPGNHVTMHELPHVTELAARLNAHLTASPGLRAG
ncbi:MAG TPA: beta-ketoacyl synthase N-terminal-like domain-containing protein [Kofleriaceae bacterium]|jgi:acyl transferase domain-containing protein/thioesterase domain-containing protein|nr:beta-ketoacyl synthase N-terminal-like domain-containing protein [Kofleriaceae bacterium]